MKPLNIWLVTSGEPLPTDNGSPRLLRTGMLAQHLVEIGHRITWWNSTFDHHKKSHRSASTSTIALSANYEIKLLRGCGYSSHISFKRFLDHQQVAAEFLKLAPLSEPPHVVIAAYPTIELADACRNYCTKQSIPFALDIRDLWPDIFEDVFPKPMRPFAHCALYFYHLKARRAMSAANALIGVTEPYLDWGLAKVGRPRNKLDAVIPFGYHKPITSTSLDTSFWNNFNLDPSKHLIVCFFGTFGRQFDFKTIIGCTSHAIPDAVRIVLCGAGDTLNYYKAITKGSHNIIFPGWIDAPKIASLMSISHVGLAPYHNNRNFIGNLPNKPIEYMSASLPILTCLEGLLTDIIRKEELGITYKEGDPQSLVTAIRFAAENRSQLSEMGRRGKALFDRKFSADVVLQQYTNAINNLSNIYHD